MRTLRRSLFCFFVSSLCVNAGGQSAQSAATQESQCFRIHVRLNGKPLDGPDVITLKTEHTESTASMEGGCFNVKPPLLAEKALDVSFTVAKNRISLVRIASGFFSGTWDVDLQDKKFGKDVHLPKHALAKEACVVVFHVGEPETALTQTGCRKAISEAAPGQKGKD